jgi:hypothetical protein
MERGREKKMADQVAHQAERERDESSHLSNKKSEWKKKKE